MIANLDNYDTKYCIPKKKKNTNMAFRKQEDNKSIATSSLFLSKTIANLDHYHTKKETNITSSHTILWKQRFYGSGSGFNNTLGVQQM